MFVKICGITNEQDALLAVAMGADAVGFMFAPSPRQIAVAQARDIARRLPPEVMTIGVFRDETSRRVVELVNAAGLHAVQLHGHETPAEGRWIRQRVQFLIQAFPAGDPMLDRIGEYEAADAVMVDAPTPGSGRVFDWALAEGLPLGRRVILAGGLHPDNVAEAIERVRPWGVDVSTGVERAPGRKDASKLMRFVSTAKEAGEAIGEETVDLDAPLASSPGPAGSGAPGAPDGPGRGGSGFDEVDTDAGAGLYDWEDDRTAP